MTVVQTAQPLLAARDAPQSGKLNANAATERLHAPHPAPLDSGLSSLRLLRLLDEAAQVAQTVGVLWRASFCRWPEALVSQQPVWKAPWPMPTDQAKGP